MKWYFSMLFTSNMHKTINKWIAAHFQSKLCSAFAFENWANVLFYNYFEFKKIEEYFQSQIKKWKINGKMFSFPWWDHVMLHFWLYTGWTKKDCQLIITGIPRNKMHRPNIQHRKLISFSLYLLRLIFDEYFRFHIPF